MRLASAEPGRRRSPSLYVELAIFLQEGNARPENPDLESYWRTLDVIVELTPRCALVAVLRRSCASAVRGCGQSGVLVLAHHEQNLAWAEKLMTDGRRRVRASVVEGLWGLKSLRYGCSYVP